MGFLYSIIDLNLAAFLARLEHLVLCLPGFFGTGQHLAALVDVDMIHFQGFRGGLSRFDAFEHFDGSHDQLFLHLIERDFDLPADKIARIYGKFKIVRDFDSLAVPEEEVAFIPPKCERPGCR